MIRAGVYTQPFGRLNKALLESKMSFFIHNRTKDRFLNLDMQDINPNVRVQTPHPCDHNKIGYNAEACWRASVLLDKDGEINEGELVRNPDTSKALRIHEKGIWIGKDEYTDDVVKARRIVFETAYIWQIGQALRSNYQISKNADIYEIFTKMANSKNEFVFYDADARNHKKGSGRPLTHLSYWPTVHLWVRYIKSIANDIGFVDEVFKTIS